MKKLPRLTKFYGNETFWKRDILKYEVEICITLRNRERTIELF